MTGAAHRVLYWSPRILGIAFVFLLGLFASDVFQEGYSFGKTLLALAIHLIPALVVGAALVISWRWERLGAVLFLGLALFYVVWTGARMQWTTYALMSGPLFLAGVLFFLSGVTRKKTEA